MILTNYNKFAALSAVVIISLLTSCKKPDSPAKSSPAPVLNITDNNNPTDGTIIMAPFNTAVPNTGYLYMLDKTGNILQSKKVGNFAINFQKWVNNGQVRYTYTEFNPNGYHIPGVLYESGDDVILDANFNEIKRVDFLPANGRTASQILDDSHDFIYLSDDHYIAMSYYQKKVTNIPASLNPSPGVNVVAPIIQEVVGGKVTWEWDATNYPEFYTSSQEWNNFSDSTVVQDYIHMNSLYMDPKDSNLIISMRNLDQIIKVSRKDGSILWRLGGVNSDFPLTPDQKTMRQHHATLTDSGQTLLIFDNGDITLRPQTRIVEMKLDEVNKKVISFKGTPVANNVFTQYMGSAQKRGNTYFVGGGTSNYVMEMDYTTNKILFQIKLDQPTYRAFKY